MDAALAAVARQDRALAETILTQAVAQAEDRYGNQSPAVANAWFELGSLLAYTGQTRRAVEPLRRAVNILPGTESEALKDHLTHQVALGNALRASGDLTGAIEVLSASVEGRLAFYGAEHAGVAFGLLPLGESLLDRGETGRAKDALQQALEILWNDGHDRVAEAIALRALALGKSGEDSGFFDEFGKLPPRLAQLVAEAIYVRIGHVPPDVGALVLEYLLGFLDQTQVGEAAIVRALSQIVQHAQNSGDLPRRRTALRRLLGALERAQDKSGAFRVKQGLALVESELGNLEEAERLYRQALEVSGFLGPENEAQVARNFGLFLSELKRPEALELLSRAVTEARRADNPVELARAQIAWAVQRQHQGDLDVAELLQTSIELLPNADRDALIAKAHLDALAAGESCGCDRLEETLAAQFRREVLRQLPPGLIQDVTLRREGDDFAVSVSLLRDPNAEEEEALAEAVRRAQQTIRQGLSEAR